MAIVDPQALEERGKYLSDPNNPAGANGIKLLTVTIDVSSGTPVATLRLEFWSNLYVSELVGQSGETLFSITGGDRIFGGGDEDQVHVTKIVQALDSHGAAIDNALDLSVNIVGDYSTYTLGFGDLSALNPEPQMDPIFGSIPFKFRPGCFNSACAPDWAPADEPKSEPLIDYLAKDFDSFRQVMVSSMMARVPGWKSSSEADLDQVLLSLFSAAADELSDYQDRVMNEAYLTTARKRVSIARLARMMDYHIHQGNQSSAWLAFLLSQPVPAGEQPGLDDQFQVGVTSKFDDSANVIFIGKRPKIKVNGSPTPQYIDPKLNLLKLFTWGGISNGLNKGDTSADIVVSPDAATPQQQKADSQEVQGMIAQGLVPHLLIQENYDPESELSAATGLPILRGDRSKRQLLRLVSGPKGSKLIYDFIQKLWILRIQWHEEDALQAHYCFSIPGAGGKIIDDASFFCGNLLPAYCGRRVQNEFLPPPAAGSAPTPGTLFFERTEDDRWGTICRLKNGPLAYRNTEPGGDVAPQSTLQVNVLLDNGTTETWTEVPNFIHSDGSDDSGSCFVVETDEDGKSLVRFGNGINGRKLPENTAKIRCTYQVGAGPDGNIGADVLISSDYSNLAPPADLSLPPCWNPFPSTDGRAPEPVEQILRRVPEAYRYKQLRAVTLQDYVDRAKEVPGVANARARYVWTGSWRAVRVAIQPDQGARLDESLRQSVEDRLMAVKLIGDDLEIRGPRFAPVDIQVVVCVLPGYLPDDIQQILEQEFSTGLTPDGRKGFFHPDLWTFGQPLRKSQIIGRIQQVEGVHMVASVTLSRRGQAPQEPIQVGDDEVIEVDSDPDHAERGFIQFDVHGESP